MKYRVITVGREFGSGGAEIARRIAARLQWRLLDRTLLDQAARQAQLDPRLARQLEERVDTWIHRVARRALWGGAFEVVAEPITTPIADADTLAAISTSLIREAHEEGNCVIVGRGSQCVLRGRADTFHIFVHAPLADRLQRVSTRQDAPPNLETWVAGMDRARAQYVRHHFGFDWADPHLYHLSLDSSIGLDAAVNAVVAAVQTASEAA